MKYFITTKEGPMIKNLDLSDSDTKYINIIDSLVAEMDEEEAKSIESKGFIIEKEEDYFIPKPIFSPHLQNVDYFPNSELNPKTPGSMKQMITTGVVKLREMGILGDKNIHVGIADSGIDGTHPDVSDNIKSFKDFVDINNTKPIDPGAHGTAVASILCGKGHYVEKFHGVAPKCSLSVARVMNEKGEGKESTILQGIDWLVEQGVSIINLSLGSWLTRYTAFSRAVDNLVDKGITVLVAAGNDGPKQITAPANAVNAITCAACNFEGEFADFSSLGPAKGPDALSLDKPDIMAWGKDVAMARAKGTTMGNIINDNYIYASGTSFATPFIAGCVVLMKSVKPDLTTSEIKEILMETAYDNNKYDKYHEGRGLVMIYNAIAKLQGEKPIPPDIQKKGCLFSLIGLR